MAAKQRVLVSGMGGQLGTRVASLLETSPWVDRLIGIDVDPPRRRLRRAEFHRIEPHDRERIVDLVTSFDPHVLIHLAVWEPDARATSSRAEHLTDEAATSIIGAAAECRSLDHMVVRSGVEIYGRARGTLTRPDESAPIAPTSTYGRMAAFIEHTGRAVGDRIGVPVAMLRLAPILGPHIPSPLGRLLRQPAVPFSLLADPPFAVIEEVDAAAAFVAAAERRVDGPLNIVASGAITVLQAAMRGRRLPLPQVGPEWAITRRLSSVMGAPIPEHVVELLHRGRLADGSRAHEVLGVVPAGTTPEVIDRLYRWESVIHIPAASRTTEVA
jgi:UDP-glucose 4-epimerase